MVYDMDSAPKKMIRVPVRINGKLISFRIEEPSLEDIDRLARSQGMDRSHWIRHACHVQITLDLIACGGIVAEEAGEPEEVTPVEEIAFVAPPQAAPEPFMQPAEPEMVRANRWS